MFWGGLLLILAAVYFLVFGGTNSKTSKTPSHSESAPESGDKIKDQLPDLEGKALNKLKEKGLTPDDEHTALIHLRKIGKFTYDPRVYKKTLEKLINE